MRQSDLDFGAVHIQSDVIASIAAMAAQEVSGVVGIWKGPWWRCWLKGTRSGVVAETRDQEVRLILPLVVEYGVHLPQVAAEVQERVRQRIEQMTQLTPVEIQVIIHDVKQQGEFKRP
jgi:uncharacterized alkaline shock family protein YloU